MFALKLDKKSAPTTDYSPSPSAFRGSQRMNEVFNKAKTWQLKRVYAEVSITAKPFFESKGFNVVKQQNVNIRGIELTNFVMEKNISP
ncbi:MAG: family N-acetyltransferase [Gammaproteobacteria bacterium]|jgi:putative acetyltransferase|nr:family N-acetyltransferase [Gammaproteobacteria bacterium]